MKLSSISKLTAASLVAGMAFAFTGTPADAQTIPSRIAVIDAQQDNVVNVHSRRYSRRGFHGPSFGFGIGLGLAAPLLAAPFTSPYGYGYGPSYGYGTSYGLAAPRYSTGGMTPGSAAWMQYCSQKYRSFDPASGTYLAYSGVRRPCQVP